MSTIVEIEKLVQDLTEQQRAILAANPLATVPGILSDEDEGIAEALRRDAEIDADPNQAISLAQLDSHIQEFRIADRGFRIRGYGEELRAAVIR